MPKRRIPLPPCRGIPKGKARQGVGMDKDITLENIISARDVLQRWHKKAVFLNELAETHIISLYVLNESRVRPTDGKTIYFCSRVLNIRYNILGNDLYDIDNIFLRPEDMAAYEKAHPEILWEPAHPEEMIIKDYGQNIPADFVRLWLKMSPVQFIDLMNRGEGPISSWEEGYRKHAENLYPEAPFFSTQDLWDESFTINVYDWLKWQKARASAGKAVGEAASGLSDVAASNAGRDAVLVATDAELAALREENAALKAELEEARTALEKARQGQTGQAKGTKVNAQKWKDSMQAACDLLVSIMQGEKDNWRSSDFTEELCKRCRDYHTDAERIAWRALPADFKHGPGRPAENTGNTEHVETIDDLPF